jgi:glycosyltransferase involved in cell wall biosynthesis
MRKSPPLPPSEPLPRVLQVIAGGAFGGAEMAFVDICTGLAAAGLPQHIIVRDNRPWSDLLRQAGLPVTEVPFRQWLDFRTPKIWRQVIGDFCPHIVQTWMNRASRRCPASQAENAFLQVGRLGGYYDLKNYRRCHHLIANTPDIARHLTARGWPSDKVTVLWNYAEAEDAPPLPRAAFNTPEGAPLLVALGRLHPAKAFDILIAAMAQLRQDVHLWIAGEGPERARLEAQIDHLQLGGRIRLIGWQDRARVLRAGDVCVFPSRLEPFGNVAIQAWAYGIPLVTTASQGPASYVRHEEDALLTPVDDPAALAAALTRLLADPALQQRLIKNGHARHAAEFSKRAVIGAYVKFYQGLLAEGKRQG